VTILLILPRQMALLVDCPDWNPISFLLKYYSKSRKRHYLRNYNRYYLFDFSFDSSLFPLPVTGFPLFGKFFIFSSFLFFSFFFILYHRLPDADSKYITLFEIDPWIVEIQAKVCSYKRKSCGNTSWKN